MGSKVLVRKMGHCVLVQPAEHGQKSYQAWTMQPLVKLEQSNIAV